jgi:DNA invertase Pin-like site-specific DNA recombinase
MEVGSKIVSLLRVSTSKQVEGDQLGLKAQREAISIYCDAHELLHIGEYVEAGVSGRASVEARTILFEAVAFAIQSGAGGFIVAKSCRLARDPFVLMTVERELNKHDIQLLSAAGEGFGDDSPSASLLRGILAQINAYSAQMTSVRTKAALKVLKDSGKLYTRPPFGFTTNNQGGLKPLPEAKLVLLAVELRNDKKPLRVVAAECGWTISKARRITERWMDRPEELKALLASF